MRVEAELARLQDLTRKKVASIAVIKTVRNRTKAPFNTAWKGADPSSLS